MDNSVHMKKLMNILAEFSKKNPQVNLAAPDTQRELAAKIVKDWGTRRMSVCERTETVTTAYEKELAEEFLEVSRQHFPNL